ncbi:alkaline ceramidase-like protein [Tanacetum coccineum]
MPRWQSVCSLNDPRAKIRKLMIEKNEGEGLIGASNRLRFWTYAIVHGPCEAVDALTEIITLSTSFVAGTSGDHTQNSDIVYFVTNYVYSSYIAEFYNTISNIPSIVLALVGLVIALSQRFEKRFSILHVSNMILSIGSMLFHATLQRLQQQGDETPMVWEMLLYICILYSPDWHYKSTMPVFLFLYGAVFARLPLSDSF